MGELTSENPSIYTFFEMILANMEPVNAQLPNVTKYIHTYTYICLLIDKPVGNGTCESPVAQRLEGAREQPLDFLLQRSGFRVWGLGFRIG